MARAESTELLEELYKLGVHEVIVPQMEAGLGLTRRALQYLQVPDQQVNQLADEVRREFYAAADPDLE